MQLYVEVVLRKNKPFYFFQYESEHVMGVRWPSLRSSPGPIWCPPRIGPRTGPIFLPENIRSSVRLFADDYRNIESPMDCQIFKMT